MKTAMKKIMTLLLVAMLLVTAIPFTAFATTGGFTGVYLQVWKNGQYKTVRSDVWIEGNGNPETKTPRDLLNHLFGGWESEYEFVEADTLTAGTVGIDDTIHSAVSPEVYLHMKSKGVYRANISFKQYGSREWIADKVIEKVNNGQDPTISYNEIVNVMPKPQAGMESYSIAEVRTPGDNTLNPGNFYTGEYGKEGQFIAYVNVTNNGQGQTPAVKNITYTVKVGDSVVADGVSFNPGNTQYTVGMILNLWNSNWKDSYNFENAYIKPNNLGENANVNPGQNVTIRLSKKTTTPDPKPTVKDINFVVTIGTTADNAKEFFSGSFKPANNGASKVGDILTNKWNSKWKNSYKFENAYVKGVGDLGENDYVEAGRTVTIRVSSKSSSGGSTGGDGGHNKFPYNVYLHVYMNNNLDSAHKTFDITDGIAADGVVDKNDIWNNLLKNYYSAKDSKGVKIELYKAEDNWVKNFAVDNQTDRIDDILDQRDDHYVHINVVLNNAKYKTSGSNADPNNPKTGDSIGTVISVMGLSATALATMFFFNKKRIFG